MRPALLSLTLAVIALSAFCAAAHSTLFDGERYDHTASPADPDYVLYPTGTPSTVHPPPPLSEFAVLMGGGTDVAQAFQSQIEASQGGDLSSKINVVILRTSGADGYNTWIMNLSSAVSSVVSIVINNRAGASAPEVLETVKQADMIFFSGGDQATYYSYWDDTPLSELVDSLRAERHVPIGGTSAGLAILGDTDFSAATGGIESPAALLDPYASGLTFNTSLVFGLSGLHDAITDTHFVTRDRMGRLITFLARMSTDVNPGSFTTARGVGVNESTAVLVSFDEATGHTLGTVVGTGTAYFLTPTEPPSVITAGVPLQFANVNCTRAPVGAVFDMTTWTPVSGMTSYLLTAADGTVTSSSGSVY